MEPQVRWELLSTEIASPMPVCAYIYPTGIDLSARRRLFKGLSFQASELEWSCWVESSSSGDLLPPTALRSSSLY